MLLAVHISKEELARRAEALLETNSAQSALLLQDWYLWGTETHSPHTEMEEAARWEHLYAGEFRVAVEEKRARLHEYFSHHPSFRKEQRPPVEVINELFEKWPEPKDKYRERHGIPLDAPPLYELCPTGSCLCQRLLDISEGRAELPEDGLSLD